MIFLTVGTQLPFDRLVSSVDLWAEKHPDVEIFGQIADPGAQGYKPSHFEWESFIEPDEFNTKYAQAEFIIAHAGMGSIISGLTHAKPVLIMPRRAQFKEHRNDHQLATAEKFKERNGVNVAFDETDVSPILDSLIKANGAKSEAAGDFADSHLLDAIRNFINN